MAKIQVGSVSLFLSDEVTHDRADIPGLGKVDGHSVFGLVMADQGLELELRYFTSHDGQAIVDCPAIDDSPEAFERLARGARIGVHPMADPNLLAIKQLRLLRYSPTMQWGNPTMTTLDELDSLVGGSVEILFREHGALRIGSRSKLFGQRGNDLAIVWERTAGAAVPFLAYTITRVVPIYDSLGQR